MAEKRISSSVIVEDVSGPFVTGNTFAYLIKMPVPFQVLGIHSLFGRRS